jgi:isoquinoline 1-oxidoreductase beta subunit
VHDPRALPLVPNPSRRKLLGYAVSAPVITGLAVTPTSVRAEPLPLTPPDSVDYEDVGDSIIQASAPTIANVRLTLGADGVYTFEMPRLEQGTGIATALAQMIAEEAGVTLDKVKINSADAQPNLEAGQITGGSCTLRAFEPYIKAFVTRARAERGLPPQAGAPTDPAQYQVIGQRIGRTDARDVVTGRKKFTMDLDVPGAVPTMCRMPSQIRGTVASVHNAAAVKAMPGVIDVIVVPAGGFVVKIPPAVAVLAETFGQAWDACRALDITWGEGNMDGHSDATILAAMKAALPPLVPATPGTIAIDAEFTWPAATHCPLEVECAVADVKPDRAEIWAGLQSPIITLQSTAAELGLSESAVTVHVIPSGGSFGRRLFWDPVQVAAQVSKLSGRIVKLMYHRSDDIRHTRLRPPQVHRVRAALNPPGILGPGNVASYQQQVGIVRLDARHGYGNKGSAIPAGTPPDAIQTPANEQYEQAFFNTMVASPYNFGAHDKALYPIALEMNTVSFRSVHIMPARTVEEIIVDEIASALGKDPVAFRTEFLRLDRARAVLHRVAGAAQWGKSMPAGFAQGVGVHMESRSFSAAVVELDCRVPTDCKVTRVVLAIDVGKPINPSGIEQQCLGGIADAISLVLKTGLTIRDGGVLEGSYNQYTIARMRDYPKNVEIIVMPNIGDPIAGMGEVAMSAPAGAIANAYARATGIKPRNFPLNARPAFTPTPPGQLPVPAVQA